MIKPISEFCSPGRSICYGIVQPGRPLENGKPIIRVANLRGDRIDTSDVMHVDPEIEQKYKRSRIRTNDVLVSLVGSMGQVAIAGPDVDGWNVARAVGVIPAVDRHHAEWIRYSLQSREAQQFIADHANTTVQSTFNLRDLSRLPIPYPDENERKEILSTVGALDDKIELNRRMSATLEEMARALYRSWFVDFDPVHARALGQSPAHMDPTTVALFPDSFGPEGLPKGWEMRSIYDFARVQYGAAFKSSLFNTKSDGRPLVRIRDLKNNTAGVHTTEAHKKEHLIEPGDTVVGMDGDFTAYSWCNEPALMNQRVCSFLPQVADNRSFVRHGIVPLLKVEEEAAVATTVIHLGKKDIDKFLLPDPCPKILGAFSSIAEPLTDRFVKLGLESITLAALRDTLLPRLMSGELRIHEAEKQVEEVV